MAVPDFSIPLKQGDDFSMACYFSDDSGAIDITGWTIKCELRTSTGADVIAAEFGFNILDQTTQKGRAFLTLTKVQTKALPLKAYTKDTKFVTTSFVADVITLDTNAKETSWGKGVFVVTPLVSRG